MPTEPDTDRDLGPEADPESVARKILLDQLTGRARSRSDLEKKLAQRGVPTEIGARLLDRFPHDDMATWRYTRALHAFRRQGDTSDSRLLLERAKEANRHVPDYLLGRKAPPPGPPGPYAAGQESEADYYAGAFLFAWKSTDGAIAWLRANDERPLKLLLAHDFGGFEDALGELAERGFILRRR